MSIIFGNSDKNKTLSVEEYLPKIRPYLKDFINDLKKSDTSKHNLNRDNQVNDSKWRRTMTLSCNKNIISIIKKDNIKK